MNMCELTENEENIISCFANELPCNVVEKLRADASQARANDVILDSSGEPNVDRSFSNPYKQLLMK